MKVKALEGDTVDSLCFRYYGTTQGVTEKVLDARHAERATASAVSPAYTADADHTGNASPLP